MKTTYPKIDYLLEFLKEKTEDTFNRRMPVKPSVRLKVTKQSRIEIIKRFVLKLQRKIVQDEKYSLEEEIRWYELELSNQNWNQTVDYKGYSSVSKQYLF